MASRPDPDVPYCGQRSYRAWLDWWAVAMFGPASLEADAPWLTKDTPEG